MSNFKPISLLSIIRKSLNVFLRISLHFFTTNIMMTSAEEGFIPGALQLTNFAT